MATALGWGFTTSEDYSSDDYWTFFLVATGFWTGDLALTTFLTVSYSLSSEDDSALIGFLAIFLAGTVSVFSCLTGFF